MPALYTMTKEKFKAAGEAYEEAILKKTEYYSFFLFLCRLVVGPKMRVRRSLRRGAEPLKKDQI